MIRGSAIGYINGRLFQEFGEHFLRFLTENKILAGKQQSPVTTGHAQITSFQFGIHGIHEVKEC